MVQGGGGAGVGGEGGRVMPLTKNVSLGAILDPQSAGVLILYGFHQEYLPNI